MNLLNSILTGVIIILLATSASLWKDNSTLSEKLELETAYKTSAVINSTICEVVRDSQSLSIQHWHKEAREAKQAASIAVSAANERAKNQEMLIKEIESAPSTNDCEVIRQRMIEDAFR